LGLDHLGQIGLLHARAPDASTTVTLMSAQPIITVS
jgi:hypothetical protein